MSAARCGSRQVIGRQAAAEVRAKFSVDRAREAVEEHLRAAEARFVSPPLPIPTDSQIRVELEGEFFAGHSFANINEQLSLQWLVDPRLALSLRRVQHNPTHDQAVFHSHRLRPNLGRELPGGAQVTIRHAFPPNWTPPERGRWVHIQPWEYGALPIDWVPPLRDRVDEIWAPSHYVRRVYERSGIAADKIRVISWGVDPEVFCPTAPPLLIPTGRRFKFLFVGGTIRRKGFDLVLDAYLSEFTAADDVCLVVKDMGTSSFYRFGNYREHILAAMADDSAPEIVYLERSMSPGQLASLYTACDCLVAPYRGEGFRLPILESMACGLPPIVPCGGASDDFVTEATGYMLPASEVECRHDWRLCGVPTELAIEVADLRAAMRQAYEHEQENRRKGELAAAGVRDRFTWARTAQAMAERLLALADRPRPTSVAPVRRGSETARAARSQAPAWERTVLPAPPGDGEAEPHDQPVTGQSPVTRPASCPEPPVPTITVCMLAHNDERMIGDSLGRIRPYVREVLVLDLGSTDRSQAIALEYGARLYGGHFADDLASLRNALLSRATSDWILCLDADELLDEPQVQKIETLLRSVPADVYGVRVQLRDGRQSNSARLGQGEVRLFRNRNDSYPYLAPLAIWTTLRSVSTHTTRSPYRIDWGGSMSATACQTAPLPPRRG
jgi:glycosyltransferase involved in cell wall biosynthesis